MWPISDFSYRGEFSYYFHTTTPRVVRVLSFSLLPACAFKTTAATISVNATAAAVEVAGANMTAAGLSGRSGVGRSVPGRLLLRAGLAGWLDMWAAAQRLQQALVRPQSFVNANVDRFARDRGHPATQLGQLSAAGRAVTPPRGRPGTMARRYRFISA